MIYIRTGELSVVVLANARLALVDGAGKVAEHALAFCASVAAIDATDSLIAVGADGSDGECAVCVLTPGGGVAHTLRRHRAAVSALAFSGALLASACANKEVVVWDAKAGTPLHVGMQGYHAARISSLHWSARGELASGGVDGAAIVWDVAAKKPRLSIKGAHAGGVTAVRFVGNDTLATAADELTSTHEHA